MDEKAKGTKPKISASVAKSPMPPNVVKAIKKLAEIVRERQQRDDVAS